MKEYTRTYKKSYNFLKWCEYWQANNFLVKHSSWKSFYPGFKKIGLATNEIIEKSKRPHIAKGYEYFANDIDSFTSFFNENQYEKGEWYVIPSPVRDIDDLFE